jgi:quercetin dioxygenase-like cupin family protein
LSEGEIEIEIEGNSEQPSIGEEVFIPANALHTVSNVGKTNNVWYYGYKNT